MRVNKLLQVFMVVLVPLGGSSVFGSEKLDAVLGAIQSRDFTKAYDIYGKAVEEKKDSLFGGCAFPYKGDFDEELCADDKLRDAIEAVETMDSTCKGVIESQKKEMADCNQNPMCSKNLYYDKFVEELGDCIESHGDKPSKFQTTLNAIRAYSSKADFSKFLAPYDERVKQIKNEKRATTAQKAEADKKTDEMRNSPEYSKCYILSYIQDDNNMIAFFEKKLKAAERDEKVVGYRTIGAQQEINSAKRSIDYLRTRIAERQKGLLPFANIPITTFDQCKKRFPEYFDKKN